MNCAGCGFQIESGFAFCPKCGARQPRACQSCGYLCAPDFAFCPKCGAGVAAAPAATNGSGSTATHTAPMEAAAPIRPATTRGNGSAAVAATPEPAQNRAEAEADRRTVTVLFADLSGFTALSERLDPEVMQSLQNELFAELTAAVQAFG